MADLTANAPIRFLGEVYTEEYFIDTAAARTIYKGQPMLIDQDVDTANVVQYVDSVTVAATDVFVGIAAEPASVASGAPQTTPIKVYVGPTIVGFPSAVFAAADLGKTVYMSDSATLSSTAADNPQLGKLVAVRDGYCFVELSAPQVCTGA